MRRALIALLLPLAIGHCGDDDEGGPGLETGQSCESADDCFVDHETGEHYVDAEITCIDRVEGGYCSHECATDEDCCRDARECDFGEHGTLAEVCAPFESLGGRWCFISCEDEILAELPEPDRETYCEDVSPDLHCRATGGGDPRKACLPEG